MESMQVYVTRNPRGKLNVRTTNPQMGEDLIAKGYQDLGWASLNWKTARAITRWFTENDRPTG
jgi:hypothetical protein